jgi:UDP-N-acetylmuramoylalanine--D-glutamate ligase
MTSFSSVVLNIGIDHVDRYLSIDEYESVKKKIYERAALSVLPVNDDGEVSLRHNISGYKVVGSSSNVVYSLLLGCICRNNKRYCEVSDMSLIGMHNHLNVCAALCLIESFGFKQDLILAALSSFVGLPHRMELVVKDEQSRSWINDSKSTNVHSLTAALLSQSLPVCLIMGGKGKGEGYAETLGRFSVKIGRLITYGEDAHLIDSQASAILDRVVVQTVSEAVDKALSYPGDVLFSPACASFDQYEDFNERGDDFKRQVMRVTAC